MSAELVVLVPVLARPHRVVPLLDSIEAATPWAHVLFLADPDDAEEITVIQAEQRSPHRRLSIDLETTGGKYSEKINRGVEITDTAYVFLGADDLHFLPGWFEAAKARLNDGVEAVGVNDLIDRRSARREHATHFLLTRRFTEIGTIDGQPGVFFEGYDHSWVDNEFIATAQARGAYAYCVDAHVRHEHPMNGAAPDDETYRKGRERFHEDRLIFESRSSLWAV